MKKTQAQRKKILNLLMRGRTITALQAENYYRCMRCAARINELRNMGYEISTTMVKIKYPDNSLKRVARYKLEKKEK